MHLLIPIGVALAVLAFAVVGTLLQAEKTDAEQKAFWSDEHFKY